MNLRCCLLAFVATACAFGQPVTVGVLLESGELAPSGTYAGGKWRTPRARSIPREWKLWGEKFHGSPVRITGKYLPDAATAVAGEAYFGEEWHTDFPKRTKEEGYHANAVGVVISPAVPVIVFLDKTKDRSEQNKVEVVLGRRRKALLDSIIAEKQLHPTKIVPAGPLYIKRSETAVDALIYYHVASWSHVYDQQACNAECGEYDYSIVGFEAWFTESAGGLRKIVTVHSEFGETNGTSSTNIDPIGIAVLDGAAYVVAREPIYEHENAVVLSLSPQSVHVVLRNTWYVSGGFFK